MRMRTGRSLVLLPTFGLLLLSVATAPVAAQDGADCTLKVSPRSGPPGTQFVFTGTGWAPETLKLKRKGDAAKVVEIPPGDDDTFTITLVAGPADSGRWRATAVQDGVCDASVAFSVGLPPTSTADGGDDGLRGAALAGFAALGGLFVAAGVVVLPRVTRNARSR